MVNRAWLTSTVVVVCFASLAAADIQWVDFSAFPTQAQSCTGLTSASGLVLDASFSNLTHVRSTSPKGYTISIDDPAWPYDSSDVHALFAIGDNPIASELTLDFTSPGGLPAGGSICIVDLETSDSFVSVRAFDAAGMVIYPDWQVQSYMTQDPNVAPPVWDAGQRAVLGQGDMLDSVNNFVLLTTDISLDSVVLGVQLVAGDGVLFGAGIPEPGSCAMLGLGTLALLRWHRNE